MRMELELLFAREPWRQALVLLQACGGLVLLDQACNRICACSGGWPKPSGWGSPC